MVKKVRVGKRTSAEYQAIGKLIEDMYLVNSPGQPKVLWFSFLRGLAYGLGIFLAGTLVIALLAWILSFFDQIPIIGPIFENIVNNLDK
ncbi:hypothetical protein KDA00_04610 [Candidatus Saccharibacteria bacterium]|nr:hypothetical protein [Candidatus Saccharibacteria bacterium]